MNDYTLNVNTDTRALRTQKFKIELQANKIGRKIERAGSVPKETFKIVEIEKVELPVEVKKIVNFAMDKNTISSRNTFNSIHKNSTINS